ncbi:MFS transporter [Saccharopolyspora sp. ASAGF58]|uniref:MFS transporter n=1 Tax=Saccharopolyspora sp. ASAGF58 TaxID=2719023 RepID=UPI00143FBBB6|nr:MFS transporter [Saccharopolyspora sp. ASAGF58]QIZ37339.1 MFS transporter [Saccharopolyspora sp. ASAGF58]
MSTAKTGAAAPAAGTAPEGRDSSAGVKITSLATGFVMATLDITVVNVAGAAIQQQLETTLAQLTWVVDGYVLTLASLLLLAGGLANRVGAKVVYQWGMAVFSIASLACALAPTAEVLIAARFAQGAGAALFMPSSLSLLVHSFPDKRKRTRMLGLWSAIVATASGFGPTIGGLMVSAFGWRSIFLLNLPIGAIGMIMTARYIKPVGGGSTKLAASGHALFVIMLTALSFALIEGPQLGWTSSAVLTAAVVTVLVAGLLVVRERRAEEHVMPWRVFQNPGFSGANIVGFLFNFALFGSMFMVGLYLQHARGASPLQAGLLLLPMTIFFPVSNIVFSRISAIFSNGLLLTAFLLLAGVSSLTMITVSPATPYWVLALAVGMANVGAGIISPAMTAALVDAAGPEHANVAGSVLNANRQIGSLVGIAAVSVVLAAAHDWTRGPQASFALVASAYTLAAMSAWRLIVKSERIEAANSGPAGA